MHLFRSILFSALFLVLQAALLIGMLPFLPLPRRWMQNAVSFWTLGMRWGLKLVVGLDYEIRGREHLPKGAAVFACKHQSAWDTFAFYLFVDDPNYILKEELMRVPIWGWCARKCGAISVDRFGGAGALKQMVRDTQDRMTRGRQVIIFPEGTRTPPGTRRPYQPGIAAIYAGIDQPVVPVAVNSGQFWGRHGFEKLPGVITVEFLPPMPPGLNRRQFMDELENRIETATENLVAEARSRFPYLSAGESTQS